MTALVPRTDVECVQGDAWYMKADDLRTRETRRVKSSRLGKAPDAKLCGFAAAKVKVRKACAEQLADAQLQ